VSLIKKVRKKYKSKKIYSLPLPLPSLYLFNSIPSLYLCLKLKQSKESLIFLNFGHPSAVMSSSPPTLALHGDFRSSNRRVRLQQNDNLVKKLPDQLHHNVMVSIYPFSYNSILLLF